MSTIDTLMVKVGIDASAIKAGAERVKKAIRGLGADVEKDGDDAGQKHAKKFLDGFKKMMGAGAKATAMTVATGFSATFLAQLGGALISGVGKLAHGLGAALALLPAAALAGGLALGALKIGLLGVGDALKAGMSGDAEAFAEALKGLAPEAQKVVREIAGLKPAFDQLKGAVQSNLFGPLVGDIAPLANQYLPTIQRNLAYIAAEFGSAANAAVGFLRMPGTFAQIADATNNASSAAGNMIRGLDGLLAAFVPLVVVGASFLPGLTSGFDGATNRLAAFMVEAQRTGQLADFIQGGLDKLASLWDTTMRVVAIFGQLRDIGATMFGGVSLGAGGLLASVERLVAKLAEFVASAEGTKTIGLIFGTLGAIVGSVFGTLERLAGVIGRVFGPYIPQIMEFVEAFMNLKSAVVDSGFDVLEPVLKVLAAVLLGAVLPAVTSLVNWLAKTRPALLAVATVITTLLIPAMVVWIQKQAAAVVAQGKQIAANARQVASWTASAASAVASAAKTAGAWVGAGAKVVASHASMGVSAIANGARVAGAWVMMAAKATVSATVGFARAVATTVAGWIVMAAQSIISAAIMAASWLIAMWPAILIIALVIGAIALLIIHWDTIRTFVIAVWDAIWAAMKAVWDWISTNWPLILAILTGPIGIAVLMIVKHWDTIKEKVGMVLGWIKDRVTDAKNWLVDRFNDVVSFVTGLPGKISSAASGLFDGFKDAFRAALNWIIGKWNDLSFKLPSVEAFGQKIGGQTLSTPNLPKFARGGIVRASPGGSIINVGEGGRDEAIVPLPRGMRSMVGGGGGATINVAGSILSERDLVRIVENAMASGRLRGAG